MLKSKFHYVGFLHYSRIDTQSPKQIQRSYYTHSKSFREVLSGYWKLENTFSTSLYFYLVPYIDLVAKGILVFNVVDVGS